MPSFNKQSYLAQLRASLPNAMVRDGALSADKKAIARDNLHALNNQYNHGPVLGGGALYGVKK